MRRAGGELAGRPIGDFLKKILPVTLKKAVILPS
jgi:hypothetical protein